MDHRYEDISDCEVDHSFFDSDFEEEVKKNGTTTKINGEDSGEIPQTEDTVESNSNMNIETKVVEDDWAKEECQEKNEEQQKEDNLGSSAYQPEDAVAFLASLNLENASSSGRNTVHSVIREKNIQTDKKCEENYYTDEEDSSDDSRNQKVRLKLSKQSSSAKVSKNIAANHSSSSSSSSPSCGSDTDCSDIDSDGCLSDSSCSSSKKNSMSNLALLSPKQKSAPGMKSVEVKPRPSDYAEESEDTVTDVTPLSTPDISPIQSFEVAASNDKKLKVKRQENVNQELYEPDPDHRCQQKVLNEALDLNNLLRAFLQLEKKEQQKLVLDQSSLGSRKNYSFTNEEVRQIDRENQRLLKELTKHATKPRSKSASVKKPSGPTAKMYHSAINRQREQQRIDRENLAFLKRLEAVKPTVGMRRSEQLMDYQRQMSYLSAAPTPRRGKSALSHHSPSHKESKHCPNKKSELPIVVDPKKHPQPSNPTVDPDLGKKSKASIPTSHAVGIAVGRDRQVSQFPTSIGQGTPTPSRLIQIVAIVHMSALTEELFDLPPKQLTSCPSQSENAHKSKGRLSAAFDIVCLGEEEATAADGYIDPASRGLVFDDYTGLYYMPLDLEDVRDSCFMCQYQSGQLRAASEGASRASSHSASSTMSRRSERPVFDSSSGALQRLNPGNIRGAWL
ncbi:hypothetical protein JD844_027039 [Phrynosoma platyrhinos]|uniref:Cilia- and flagella-associated protein 97 n=1 Tax=Phrynosoma platyrhinos TaxID=52577 RepID=A0ABQ7SFM4_PHRPL|nr:hypothetical protein JD844_027039 [Phrynosoma platyrhinos]